MLALGLWPTTIRSQVPSYRSILTQGPSPTRCPLHSTAVHLVTKLESTVNPSLDLLIPFCRFYVVFGRRSRKAKRGHRGTCVCQHKARIPKTVDLASFLLFFSSLFSESINHFPLLFSQWTLLIKSLSCKCKSLTPRYHTVFQQRQPTTNINNQPTNSYHEALRHHPSLLYRPRPLCGCLGYAVQVRQHRFLP